MSRSLKIFWTSNKDIFAAAVLRLPAAWRAHFPLQVLGMSPAFHSAEALRQALASASGRGRVLAALRKKQTTEPKVVEMAIQALPMEMQQEMRDKAVEEPRRAKAARHKAEEDDTMDQWEAAMAARRSIRAEASAEAQTLYEERVAEDRARVRRKFFPQKDRQVKHSGHRWSHPMPAALQQTVQDLQSNDTGLPAAQASPVAAMLEQWCKVGSWAVCKACHSLEPRHLKEIDARRTAHRRWWTQCKWCAGAQGVDGVPQVADVPKPLRSLTPACVKALQPLELDCGPYQRPPHGYRVHTALARLAWAQQSVEEKLAALPRQERKPAKKAFTFLMRAGSRSEYRAFIKQHEDFLRQNPGPADADRKRPLQMLEVTWLYAARLLRFTRVASKKSFDPSNCIACCPAPRQRALSVLCGRTFTGIPTTVRQSSAPPTFAGCSVAGCSTRGTRMRRTWAAAPSAVPSCGRSSGRSWTTPPTTSCSSSFIFDLCLWSDIGAKRHVQPQLSMRIMLKGCTFTPAYWAQRHAAVLDLQRQCGYPILFKTWAPYEWSAPYHAALLHDLAALLRSRQHSAGLETLHLAHVMVELLREWVAGGARKHGEQSSTWKSHAMAATLPGGQRCRINFAARLEFQDGKRKQASQQYHGRGAVHLHALLFAEELEALQLHSRLQATEPPEGHHLRGYVDGPVELHGQRVASSRSRVGMGCQGRSCQTAAYRKGFGLGHPSLRSRGAGCVEVPRGQPDAPSSTLRQRPQSDAALRGNL